MVSNDVARWLKQNCAARRLHQPGRRNTLQTSRGLTKAPQEELLLPGQELEIR